VLSAIETMHDVTSNPSMLDYNYPYVNFAHTELLNYNRKWHAKIKLQLVSEPQSRASRPSQR
jgi:hypothetical protein